MGGAGDFVKKVYSSAFDPLGLAKKPPTPKRVKPPDEITPEEAAKAAQLAADRKKKQAIAAYGASDTILTGPKGLGASGGGKKLLGD
jgi:hypothetical protein